MVATNEDAEIVGAMWLMPLGKTPYYYIPYIAIDRFHQGGGIGRGLFTYALDYLAQKGTVENLLWEIEVPTFGVNDERMKRLRFYEKQGAQVVSGSQHYSVPDVTGCGYAMPLWVMVAPIGGYALRNDHQHALRWVHALLTNDNDYAQHTAHRDAILHQMACA